MGYERKSRAKSVFRVILILLILALAGFAGYKIFQVKHINVEGNSAFTDEYVSGLANIETGTHLLKVDEDKVTENVESEPYLDLVSIDYKLPDTVVLKVSERTPAFIVVYAGNSLLLDREGYILETDGGRFADSLPCVEGLVVNAVNLGKQAEITDSYKLEVLTGVVDALNEKSLLDDMSALDFSDINDIKLDTRTGVRIVFGQSDGTEEKMTWINKMLPSLAAEGKTGGTIDVSAGDFATYQQPEGAAAPAETEAPQESAAPTETPGTAPEETAPPKPTPEETNGDDEAAQNTEKPTPEEEPAGDNGDLGEKELVERVE